MYDQQPKLAFSIILITALLFARHCILAHASFFWSQTSQLTLIVFSHWINTKAFLYETENLENGTVLQHYKYHFSFAWSFALIFDLQLLSSWKVAPFTELLQQFVYFSNDYHVEYSYKHIFGAQNLRWGDLLRAPYSSSKICFTPFWTLTTDCFKKRCKIFVSRTSRLFEFWPPLTRQTLLFCSLSNNPIIETNFFTIRPEVGKIGVFDRIVAI